MITHKTKWLLVGLVCLALWPPAAYGQSSELVDAYYRAGALFAEGHYQEALPFAQEALRLSEREYGPDHPATATMLTTLAKIYHAQDKYAEAEPLFERALAIREVSGSYPGLARTLNNMAQLYFKQGRYAEAEPLIKRSLAIREKALGSENNYVAGGLNNLAAAYEHQGKYAAAEPLYRRSLAMYEKILGPEDSHLPTVLDNYARLLRKTGRGTEAAKMKARAKAIRAKHAERNTVK